MSQPQQPQCPSNHPPTASPPALPPDHTRAQNKHPCPAEHHPSQEPTPLQSTADIPINSTHLPLPHAYLCSYHAAAMWTRSGTSARDRAIHADTPMYSAVRPCMQRAQVGKFSRKQPLIATIDAASPPNAVSRNKRFAGATSSARAGTNPPVPLLNSKFSLHICTWKHSDAVTQPKEIREARNRLPATRL